jgi:hypothetical protein
MKTKKLKLIQLAAIAAGGIASGVASAALPTGATAAFTALETDGMALIDAAWPVVTALTVGFIIIGLFKKAAAKAV